jgi:hypothetical protein
VSTRFSTQAVALFCGTWVLLLGLAVARAAAPAAPAEVRVRERVVFTLFAARSGKSAEERARAASSAIESVLDEPEAPKARVEEQPGTAVVFVGKTPVVTLGTEDAEAAGGEITLHVYAASVVASIDDALRAERRRSAIADHVFSLSLLVFLGVLAFLLVRRIGDTAKKARAWVRAHPDRIPALRLGKIEVVRPLTVRGALSVALALGHRIGEFAVAYLWLIFALSRFDATRAYTDRLAGFVLVPLSALVGRLGAALPLVVVAAIGAVAVGVAVRFVDLFFVGVGKGETQVSWLPRELAGPTSVLVRAGIVLSSIVLAAPLITGTDDGALSRAGVVALAALGLSCTPVLACAAAGVPAVFGRRLLPGSYVEAGGRSGMLREITLLEIVLQDSLGCQVRVPQLLGLWHPTRVLGASPPAAVEIVVDPKTRPAVLESALTSALGARCDRLRLELVSIDADGARWRVSGVPSPDQGMTAMADSLVKAIADAGIALGRSGTVARTTRTIA